jgi:hypothetical protein
LLRILPELRCVLHSPLDEFELATSRASGKFH